MDARRAPKPSALVGPAVAMPHDAADLDGAFVSEEVMVRASESTAPREGGRIATIAHRSFTHAFASASIAAAPPMT